MEFPSKSKFACDIYMNAARNSLLKNIKENKISSHAEEPIRY